jgi:hypothetical protein
MPAGPTAPTPDRDAAELPDFLDEAAEGVAEIPAPRPGVLRFARMTGSSICARDAAPWVTDFLNAAYYRRPVTDRDVDDMRLAFSILTSYWWSRPSHRRLHASDLVAFHRAFGAHRFDTTQSARGTLSLGDRL